MDPIRPTAADIDELIACSTVRWVADDLRAGLAGRAPLRHDLGLDLIEPDGLVAWWTPASHAAKLLHGGVHMNLSAPGPRWLADIGDEFTGRDVWAGTIADIADAHASGYAKPAEAKIPGLDAAWWDNTTEFAAAALDAGMAEQSWIQISDRRLDIVEEHRCYVLGSDIVATSPYLDADGCTYEPGWETDQRFDRFGAIRYAHTVAAALDDNQPDAYTLDVAKLSNGTWVVLEANPAWCSGFYGCDLAAVVDTIVAASAVDPGRWKWAPEPAFIAEAERRPLRPRRSVAAPAGTRTR